MVTFCAVCNWMLFDQPLENVVGDKLVKKAGNALNLTV